MQEMVTAPFSFFLISITYGMGLLFFYDIYRAMRIIFHHKPVFVIIEDLSFSIFVAITSFWFLCTYNYGELRGFFFLGIFLGMLIYYTKISPQVVKIDKYIFSFVKNLMLIMINAVMHPLVHIQRNIKWRLKKEKKNVTMALKRETRRGVQDGRKETIK